MVVPEPRAAPEALSVLVAVAEVGAAGKAELMPRQQRQTLAVVAAAVTLQKEQDQAGQEW